MNDSHDWPMRPPLDDPFDGSWDGDPEWFLDLLEGTLPQREVRRVRDLMDRDPELARRYASYCEKVDLLHELGSQEAANDGGAALRARILTATVGAPSTAVSPAGTEPTRGSPWAWMGAATMAAASLAFFFSVREGGFRAPEQYEAARDAAAPRVARAPELDASKLETPKLDSLKLETKERSVGGVERPTPSSADKRVSRESLKLRAGSNFDVEKIAEGLGRNETRRARRYVAKKVGNEAKEVQDVREAETRTKADRSTDSDDFRQVLKKRRADSKLAMGRTRKPAARKATPGKAASGDVSHGESPGAKAGVALGRKLGKAARPPAAGGPSTPGPAGPSSPGAKVGGFARGTTMRAMVDRIEKLQEIEHKQTGQAKLGAVVKPLLIVDQDKLNANRLAMLAERSKVSLYGSNVLNFQAGWRARGLPDLKQLAEEGKQVQQYRLPESQKPATKPVELDLFRYALTNPSGRFDVYKVTGTRQAFVGFLTELKAKPQVYYSAVPDFLFETPLLSGAKLASEKKPAEEALRVLEDSAKHQERKRERVQKSVAKRLDADQAKKDGANKAKSAPKRTNRGRGGRPGPERFALKRKGKKAKKPTDEVLELYLLIKSKAAGRR